MGGHRSLLMAMVWVWVQIRRKMSGSGMWQASERRWVVAPSQAGMGWSHMKLLKPPALLLQVTALQPASLVAQVTWRPRIILTGEKEGEKEKEKEGRALPTEFNQRRGSQVTGLYRKDFWGTNRSRSYSIMLHVY
jgi:hypothetical protein